MIDDALVPWNCEVADSVFDIAPEGDIDHLVATPMALWVVETKVRAVSKDRFRAVLDRIARNVHAVEAWAPGVPVRGVSPCTSRFRASATTKPATARRWSCTTREACATCCAQRRGARGRLAPSWRIASGGLGRVSGA